MVFLQPLDFWQLFVNTFAGTPLIFLFVALILLAGLAARFKMSNTIFGIMLMLFAIMFANWFSQLYVVAVIIGGMIISFVVVRLIKN